MYGLGKPRSKFGKYVDSKNIKHKDLLKISGVSKDTITKACTPGEVIREVSKHNLVLAINKLTGGNKKVSDFW